MMGGALNIWVVGCEVLFRGCLMCKGDQEDAVGDGNVDKNVDEEKGVSKEGREQKV
jgi:hypothetical protein